MKYCVTGGFLERQVKRFRPLEYFPGEIFRGKVVPDIWVAAIGENNVDGHITGRLSSFRIPLRADRTYSVSI